MKRRFFWIGAAAVLAVFVPAASCQLAMASDNVELSWGLDSDGTVGPVYASEAILPEAPLPAARSATVSRSGWTWQACVTSARQCRDLKTRKGSIRVSGVASGTYFRAISSSGGTARTSVWRGRVKSLSPPSVDGEVRVGERVTPIPGRWRGGWATDRDETQLAACRSRHGGCTVIAESGPRPDAPHVGTVLGARLVGDYLRVADHRFTGRLGEFDGDYFPRLILKANAITAAAIVGRIAPAGDG